ncbi:MAG TPA: hypothetical protein VK154_00775 [Chitinophagales bacterium]|nr:hypothetical protein [Chitinophagales bacterium]
MKTKHAPAAIGLLLLFLAFTGCQKEKDNNTGTEKFTIRGTVKSPNLQKTIANALIYADEKTSTYKTYTDAQGRYELKIPLGAHTIYIETGDGKLFKNSFTVNSSTPDEDVEVPETQSILTLHGRLAYIAGTYDHIEAVVRDTLGYAIAELQTSALDNFGLVSSYDAIFINCGATQQQGVPSTAGYENLGNFVAQGGSIFASDFGLDYLKGESDGTCTPAGGFIDDATLCSNRNGTTGTVSSCQIIDPGLQNALGTTSIPLEYDLGGWEVISQFDNTFWSADITEATSGPLLLHTENYTNSTGTTPGKIYWTTFHNGFNSGVSTAPQKILEYVIVNL